MSRLRESSNAYACGSNQNSGNFLTSTPTTRVIAPPGGSSSLSLGFDDTPRRRTRDDMSTASSQSRSSVYDAQSYASCHTSSRQRRCDTERSQMPCINEDSMSMCDSAIRPSRRDLGASSHATSQRSCRDSEASSQASSVRHDRDRDDRMSRTGHRSSRRDSEASSYAQSLRSCRDREADSQASSAFRPTPRVSSNAYASGSQQNCGNVLTDVPSTKVSAPPGGASSLSLGGSTSGAHRRREKEEIEGSRPRVRRPEVRVNAPPGGTTAINHDMTVEQAQQLDGKKHFGPDAGAKTANRDPRAKENLRYYQSDCEGVGKQHVRAPTTRATQRDSENQRFHLDNDERLPRKGQHQQDRKFAGALPHCSSSGRSSASTCAPSECDDLPLGADWSSFDGSECGSRR